MQTNEKQQHQLPNEFNLAHTNFSELCSILNL